MVTSIILIRHASSETINPEQPRTPGLGLTESGKEQAKKTAMFLQGLTFSKIYTSKMTRAIETAQIITNQEIKQQENLNEFNKIVFEEQPEKETKQLEKFNENIEQALKTKTVFEEILRKHRDSKVLIVAHGNVIRYLVCCALSLKPHKAPNFIISNASITHLFFEGNQLINVGCINSTTHLFLK
ncbi:histidine phosphatase family protein [Candidatus Woesearchaeota archaeon]|jgi:broad specificity phosphatase PhoE|nr:histidine phosphatase family protein [Candidatus Woesearchaeota archaeon]